MLHGLAAAPGNCDTFIARFQLFNTGLSAGNRVEEHACGNEGNQGVHDRHEAGGDEDGAAQGKERRQRLRRISFC